MVNDEFRRDVAAGLTMLDVSEIGDDDNMRDIDRDDLLKVADEIEEADVDGVIDWAARIRNAVGETRCEMIPRIK